MRRFLPLLLLCAALLASAPSPASAQAEAFRYKIWCGKTADADCEKPSEIQEAPGTCEVKDASSAITTCRALCPSGTSICKMERIQATADESGAPAEYKLVNPLGTANIPQLIGQILNIFLGILGSGAFLMFVYGGFLWLISGGSADRIKKGKDTMVWAALGLVLVFSSAALVRFVLQVVGAGS